MGCHLPQSKFYGGNLLLRYASFGWDEIAPTETDIVAQEYDKQLSTCTKSHPLNLCTCLPLETPKYGDVRLRNNYISKSTTCGASLRHITAYRVRSKSLFWLSWLFLRSTCVLISGWVELRHSRLYISSYRDRYIFHEESINPSYWIAFVAAWRPLKFTLKFYSARQYHTVEVRHTGAFLNAQM